MIIMNKYKFNNSITKINEGEYVLSNFSKYRLFVLKSITIIIKKLYLSYESTTILSKSNITFKIIKYIY